MANSLHFGKFAAVLPAGGLGKRMGGTIPKQLMKLGDRPVYQYSLETFLNMDEIAEVVIAVPADWKDYFEKDIFVRVGPSFGSGYSNNLNKLKIVVGGAERWQSVENGINALTSNAEYVLVHDVARPFISDKIIREIFETLINKGSCLVAKPAIDTIKIASDGRVESTIDRRRFGSPKLRKQPASICSSNYTPALRKNRSTLHRPMKQAFSNFSASPFTSSKAITQTTSSPRLKILKCLQAE